MAKTVAWIEEDDVIAPVVRQLERAGYVFHRLHDVRDALANLDTIRRARVILLDMILPPGEGGHADSPYPGLDLLRELRQTHHVSTPVVVLSVVTPAGLRQQLHELHVEDIVRKPVRPTELKERVEQALAEAKAAGTPARDEKGARRST